MLKALVAGLATVLLLSGAALAESNPKPDPASPVSPMATMPLVPYASNLPPGTAVPNGAPVYSVIDGRTYLIDPQTRTVLGPFD